MKHLLLFSALLAWLPLGLQAEPFTYESAAELSAALDVNADGLADFVVVDKATGVRQLAYQEPDGAFWWAEPRSTGIDGVTALTGGRFTTLPLASSEGFAVAAPSWNRVTVVPNPADAETTLNAALPGIGPNLVVALDLAGDPALDDLAIATCWEDPPGDSRLYASAWNGITASNLYDPSPGLSGPLTHGNRARLTSAGPWVLGVMRPTGTTSEFITRIPGTLGYDVGPAVTGWSPDATWVWGEFDGSGYSQFLFYAPGETGLYVRPVEENEPGVFSFGNGADFDLGQPIQQVCVLQQSTGALLLIVFGDGRTAGTYDFDGTNAPVLRQALNAPSGSPFSLAGPLGEGDFLLLHGPAGGAGASTGWERWCLDGPQHTLAGSGSLPTFTSAGGRANVFVYSSDPALNPDQAMLFMFQAGDWSVAADTVHAVLDVTAEYFVDSASGLGNAAITGFGRRLPGFYLPGLNEVCATVNQRSAAASVACLSPALGIPMGDIAFDPPAGVYAPGAGGGLVVRIHATPDGPIHFRTDPSQPWALYSPDNPPSLGSNTTLWAYADNRTGFYYYDYADYAWHYADNDRYTPIRTATYRIAAAPALEAAPQVDANADGLGDAWSTAFGITDPLEDPDGDGANNRAEFVGRSDPLDPASLPIPVRTVTFQPGAHGTLAGGTPDVTVTVTDGDSAPAAPGVAPAWGWLFAGWSPVLPANVTADVETTAQYVEAGPALPIGDFLATVDAAAVNAGRGLWDCTGTYATTAAGASLTLVLAHDAQGKLTGLATYLGEVGRGTSVEIRNMSIKGAVKSAGGRILLQFAVRGTDASARASVALAFVFTLDPASGKLTGPMTGRVTSAGARHAIALGESPQAWDIASPMDGTWELQFVGLHLGGQGTVKGVALLRLSNQRVLHFGVKGKTKGDGLNAVMLSAARADLEAGAMSAKGVVRTLEGNWAELVEFSIRGYGQRLNW